MKKNIKNILYALGLSLTIASCSLQEYNPVSLSEDETIHNFAGWKGYQSNCYSGLWGSLIGMPYGIVSEAGTDLWTLPYGNHGNAYKDLLAYEQFTTSSGIVKNVWDLAWGSIYACNKTIDLSTQLTDSSGNGSNIKILVAETKLLRAYYYSVLVTQFGDVPLLIKSDAEKSLTPTRNKVPEIYAQILTDLRTAFNDLPVAPLDGNRQRVVKKSALGLLARVYAQGAGEGLSEGGKTYWVRAKEVADSLITNMAAYGATMYDDFSKVFAPANNRNNAEVLFTAYGLDPYNASYDYFSGNAKPNIYLHYYPKFDDAFGTSDVFKRSVNSNTNNAYYGRLNQAFIGPTKYLINCFNAKYDKRWENTFVTAFTNYSGVQAIASNGNGAGLPTPANVKYTDASVLLTSDICKKYGIDLSHVGQRIYPYVDIDAKYASQNATWQYIPKIWTDSSGSASSLTTIANANVHPYPLAPDEFRFFAYLSKDPLTAVEKQARRYVTINIDDLFDASDPTGSTYKTPTGGNGLAPITLANLFPAMQKFNHNFDGGWLGGNFQQKLGNIMIMRMAEVYLIAAEATMHINSDGAAAAAYLNKVRQRACRNPADFNVGTGMQLTTATMDDVFDEYARELCGEYNRWAILKRNKAFESRLQRFNKTAFVNFVPARHYNRPIPFGFLNTINNGTDFGTNGY